MRYALISLVLFLVMGTQAAFATGASAPSNPTDEYAAHRHVRLMHDLAMCVDDMVSDIEMAARELTDLPYNRGLAYGYTNPMVNADVFWPMQKEHLDQIYVIEKSLILTDDLCTQIKDLCEDIIGSNSVEWKLSAAELELVADIWGDVDEIQWRIPAMQNELAPGMLSCCNNDILRNQALDLMDPWIDQLLADIDYLASPSMINCDW